MNALFLGVDVGAGGGIAVIDDTGFVQALTKMPETDADLLVALNWASMYAPLLSRRGMLEKVHSSPQMGVTSAFSFGSQYGRVRMALTAAQIPFDEVTPFKWQRRLECLTGGDKNVSKARAQQLFPTTKITHHTADALLLAEYARRIHWLDSVPSFSTRKGAGSGKGVGTPMGTASSHATDKQTERIGNLGDGIEALFRKD